MLNLMGLKKLILILACLLVSGQVWAYSYGPACQWIRLRGQVETEAGFSPKGPILINVSYQLEGQSVPGVLLASYPVPSREFFFVLAPFQEIIERAVFLPFNVSFDQKIDFTYFATAANGRHRSPVYTTTYRPERLVEKNLSRCQTDLRFETMVLKRRRF